MVRAVVISFLLSILSTCSGEGNIHLLEEEIAAALRTCSQISDKTNLSENGRRQRRSDQINYDDLSPRIDANTKQEANQYGHERRNNSFRNQIHVLNRSEYENTGYEGGRGRENFINTIPRPALGNTNSNNNEHNYSDSSRIKRNEPLMNKDVYDQCLSQCVFANLQVVDSRGIPREAELWSKVQTAVTSQQSRTLLRDQIRACFQELQTESEDNGCSYSNKLERCLMLRFSDRRTNGTQTNSSDS